MTDVVFLLVDILVLMDLVAGIVADKEVNELRDYKKGN